MPETIAGDVIKSTVADASTHRCQQVIYNEVNKEEDPTKLTSLMQSIKAWKKMVKKNKKKTIT